MFELDQNFKQFIDKSHIGYTKQAPNGEPLYINDAGLSMLGVTSEQWFQRSAIDKNWVIIKEDGTSFDMDEWPNFISARTKESVRGVVMGIFIPSRQSWSWIVVDTVPILLPDGNVDYVMAAFSDITELKQQANTFKIIADNSRDMITLHAMDEYAIYTYASPSSLFLFGYEPEELVGQKAYAFFHADDIATVEHVHHQYSTDPWIMRYRLRCKNGNYVWVESHCNIIKHSIPQQEEILAVTRNIEHIVKVEQKLRVANENTLRLSQIRSSFLANITHEIRTPINGVLSLSEILAETKLDDRQKKYVGLILDSARTMSGIVNQVLDFSKIDADKIEVESFPFSLRQALSDVTMAFPNVPPNVTLNYDVDESLPDQYVGDPTRLKQILTNLVSNGLKFTKQGSVTMTVRPYRKTSSLLFFVSDTGIGMSQTALDRLFTPFVQADPSTTRKYGGTGLGLSIVKSLIEIMGGSISVTSQEGQGTTFSFVLPLRRKP